LHQSDDFAACTVPACHNLSWHYPGQPIFSIILIQR